MHLVMIGGSDAGISAALRARELDPAADVTVVVADAYPNFSICGIPYYLSGQVTHWRNLAHRTIADLEAARLRLRLDTTARRIALQLFGHRHAEIAKRIDIAATAIYHNMTLDAISDLDLSYTPPLGSPWEALQMGAQAWLQATQQH